MASVRKEIVVRAHPEEVWSAVRDFGRVHERLARGLVVDTFLDGESRLLTFANGTVVRELLVDLDEGRRRLAYAAVGCRALHHHATMEVFDAPRGRTRLVWTIDVLPDHIALGMRQLVAVAADAIARTLDGVLEER